MSPPAARAAAMFAQNLAIWGPQALAGEREVAYSSRTWTSWPPASGRPAGITWELRRLAWRA